MTIKSPNYLSKVFFKLQPIQDYVGITLVVTRFSQAETSLAPTILLLEPNLYDM